MSALAKTLFACALAAAIGLMLVCFEPPTPPSFASLIIAPTGSTPPPPSGCGSTPTPAVNAGFTTLAKCYDFTTAAYATQSNYLDCGSNTNPSLPWHWGKEPDYYPIELPCQNNPGGIFQVTDPVFGNKALDFQYLSSYSSYPYESGQDLVGMNTAYSLSQNTNYPAMYISARLRMDGVVGNVQYLGTAFLYAGVNVGVGPIEWDITEPDPSFGRSLDGIHNWGTCGGCGSVGWSQNNFLGGGWNPPSCWNSSVTNYCNYDLLITTDGTSHYYGCWWIGGNFQSCQDAGANSSQYNMRWFVILFNGSEYGPPALNVTTNTYIQYVGIWSCSSWASAHCNGSTLSGSGPPNLTYYH